MDEQHAILNAHLGQAEDEVASLREQLREREEQLERVEDALLGYFAGGYPRGSCESKQDAERELQVGVDRAIKRLARASRREGP